LTLTSPKINKKYHIASTESEEDNSVSVPNSTGLSGEASVNYRILAKEYAKLIGISDISV